MNVKNMTIMKKIADWKMTLLLACITMAFVACGGGEANIEEPVAQPTKAAEAVQPTDEPEMEMEEEEKEEHSTGSEGEMMEGTMLPAVDPLDVTGNIAVAGSSTVFPLSERMASIFTDDGYDGTITIDSIGSGAGFERFCDAAESDISNASRPIKDKEVELCQANGREPIEFRVGTDALAVVVSKENDFLVDASLEELAAIFTAENWSDVNADWPNETIFRYSPGTDSGTFDYFVEEVFEKDQEPILSASNTEFSEDDNVVTEGVLGSPYAIGYFGYAYYQENADALNIISIDGIEASNGSVDDGSYALARPMYMYSTATIMKEKPQVGAFINYFLTNVNNEIVDVGYFPATPDALEAAKNGWVEANK